jgi:hypothetical protein
MAVHQHQGIAAALSYPNTKLTTSKTICSGESYTWLPTERLILLVEFGLQ